MFDLKLQVVYGPPCFEFVQANITEPAIRERFEEAMRTLRGKSSDLSEMLLFVAYVHACRTPVSMDMALAYWRDAITDFSKVYDLFHKVGALVTEYEGDPGGRTPGLFCG